MDPGVSPGLIRKEHPQPTVRVDPKHSHVAIDAGTGIHPHAVPATIGTLSIGPDADPRLSRMMPQRGPRRGRPMRNANHEPEHYGPGNRHPISRKEHREVEGRLAGGMPYVGLDVGRTLVGRTSLAGDIGSAR